MHTFLLYYRTTEHCTTGVSPASLMLGRNLRTKLDAMKPDCGNHVWEAERRQIENRGGDERALREGEEIWLRQYQGGIKWSPGTVAERLGDTDYRVVDEIGRKTHRHIDQLRRRSRSSLVCAASHSDRRESDGRLEAGDRAENDVVLLIMYKYDQKTKSMRRALRTECHLIPTLSKRVHNLTRTALQHRPRYRAGLDR